MGALNDSFLCCFKIFLKIQEFIPVFVIKIFVEGPNNNFSVWIYIIVNRATVDCNILMEWNYMCLNDAILFSHRVGGNWKR